MISDTVSGVNSILMLPRPFSINLLGHQMAFDDLELLFFGVARQFQHFHPVAQRRRNRIEHVGRGQEQHLGEIEGNIEIMIDEGVVLLGVEYLEQRRGRVAAEIGVPSLSTSSRMNSGLLEPALRSPWMMRPGNEPM